MEADGSQGCAVPAGSALQAAYVRKGSMVMKELKKMSKRGLALLLALALCMGMVCTSALAADGSDHVHNQDGWVCTQAEPAKSLVCGEEHEHTDECYTVSEGEWSCVNAVQEFLDAVDAIPEVTEDNADEAAEYVYGEVSEAYEALLGTGYEDREDVKAAEAVMAEAIAAVDAAVDVESGTYGGYYYEGNSLAGFGAAIGYDPKDTSKFPKTDGTDISVIPWNFYNPDHAKDYYYYTDYRLGYGDNKTHPRTEPAPDPVQSSYFEKTYNWTDLPYYAPLEYSKTTVAGATGSLSWRQGVTNFNDSAGGFVPTIPSVYLYRLEEVEGTDYIAGGRDGITFKANDEVKLESSGGPVYKPTGPYIQCDVPVAENAPKGAQIQVRFRLAMGYEMEWQASEGTYNWYVQDFILNLTVGEGGSTTDPDVPVDDADVVHHVYMPAGTSTIFETYIPHYAGGGCSINGQSVNKIKTGDTDIAVIDAIGQRPIDNYGGSALQIRINSADNAVAGEETELKVSYKYYSNTYTCTEKIIVHIIEPRTKELEVNTNEQIAILGSDNVGTFEKVRNADVYVYSAGAHAVTVGNSNKNGYTATRTSSTDDATAEYQYRYVTTVDSGHKFDGTSRKIEFRQQTVYVDVTNFTTPDETDDPDSIDGLDIIKTADKMSVVGGEEITYIITVTNDSTVAKTVTVTDPLPNGVSFKSFDPDDGTAKLESDGYTVTWTPTVPAKSNKVLKITCTVDDNAGGYLTNVARMVTADGSEDEATVQPVATPKPKTYTVIWKAVDENNPPEWKELHKEDNVTAGSEPTWETVKANSNLNDPAGYTLNGKTYTWKGTWREEWNTDKTVKTYWAEYQEKSGGEGPGEDTKPTYSISVDKIIDWYKMDVAEDDLADGDTIVYKVTVINTGVSTKNTPATLYDIQIDDTMSAGLSMVKDENGVPVVTAVDGSGNAVTLKYLEMKTVDGKTQYFWEVPGEFAVGAQVILTYSAIAINETDEEMDVTNFAHAKGYTTPAPEGTSENTMFQAVQYGVAKIVQAMTLNNEDSNVSGKMGTDDRGDYVEDGSGTGTGTGGSGTTITVQPKVTVTYDPNGGKWSDGTTSSTTEKVKKDTKVTIKGAPEAPEGKEFTGWLGSDGKTYQSGGELTITGDLTLTAQWKDKEVPVVEYTVTYKDGDKVLKEETVKDGDKITVEGAPEAPEGKEFTGWLGSDGKTYQPGEELTITGDLTLTAQWKDKAPGQTPGLPVVPEIPLEPSQQPSEPVESQEPSAPVESQEPDEDIESSMPPQGELPELPEESQEPSAPVESEKPDEDIDDGNPPQGELPEESQEPGVPVESEEPDEDIDDGNPPQGELPEESQEPDETIDDEKPPMGDAPQTGDNLGVWIAAAVASGAGLMGVIGATRKRKEDEEA